MFDEFKYLHGSYMYFYDKIAMLSLSIGNISINIH